MALQPCFIKVENGQAEHVGLYDAAAAKAGLESPLCPDDSINLLMGGRFRLYAYSVVGRYSIMESYEKLGISKQDVKAIIDKKVDELRIELSLSHVLACEVWFDLWSKEDAAVIAVVPIVQYWHEVNSCSMLFSKDETREQLACFKQLVSGDAKAEKLEELLANHDGDSLPLIDVSELGLGKYRPLKKVIDEFVAGRTQLLSLQGVFDPCLNVSEAFPVFVPIEHIDSLKSIWAGQLAKIA